MKRELQFEKIIRAYGQCLENVSSIIFLIPEHLLPFDKEEIRNALLVSMDFVEDREAFISGSAELERFVSLEEILLFENMTSYGKKAYMDQLTNKQIEIVNELRKRYI